MATGQQIKGQALFQRQSENQQFNGPDIICDGIRTPENFGAILRIADATGCKTIILLNSDLDLNSKKLGKLARSTNQHLDIRSMSLAEFTDYSRTYKQICALEITTDSRDAFRTDISQCDAIVVGHESQGISPGILELCSQAIHLPMFGVNGSMNLSHALAVCLYEWRRQANN